MRSLKNAPLNVWGEALQPCCELPMVGFYRDGRCRTGPEDAGLHVVCAQMTDAFLAFSRERGNDLSTPMPQFDFPGLRAGDYWCLCADRWREALQAEVAPPVRLEATEQSALRVIPLDVLSKHAVSKRKKLNGG